MFMFISFIFMKTKQLETSAVFTEIYYQKKQINAQDRNDLIGYETDGI